MIELTPELQAAVAPLEAPVVPTPTVPQVAAPFQSNPTAPTPAPTSGFAPLGAPTAPAAAQPAVPAPTKPTSFGAKLHEALMKNPLHPGGVLGSVAIAGLDALSGGVTSALSNVAAPADSGAGVLAQTAKNIEAAKQAKINAAQKAQQQQFENQLKTNEDTRAQSELGIRQKQLGVQMAAAHTAAINSARIARHEDDTFRAQMLLTSNTLAQPYLEQGGSVVGQDIPESEKMDFIQKNAPQGKDGKPDYSQFLSFQDGEQPVMDPKTGKQEINLDGMPVYQRTYQIVKIGPEVTLTTQGQVDLLNKYDPNASGGTPWQVGQKLPGQSYAMIAKQAQANETVALNVEKTQSEIRKNMTQSQKNKADAQLASQSAAQKAQNLRTSQMFAKYLGQTGGDPILALSLLKRSKDANQINAVEQLYGAGTLTKLRAQNLTTLTKTITDDESQLNNPTTSAVMSDDDKANMVAELRAARMARNSYLDLHPNDPPQFAEFVTKLDAFKDNPQQLSSQILLSKKADPSTKRYLLNHYGLPIPAYLQVAPPAAAAPKQ